MANQITLTVLVLTVELDRDEPTVETTGEAVAEEITTTRPAAVRGPGITKCVGQRVREFRAVGGAK